MWVVRVHKMFWVKTLQDALGNHALSPSILQVLLQGTQEVRMLSVLNFGGIKQRDYGLLELRRTPILTINTVNSFNFPSTEKSSLDLLHFFFFFFLLAFV